MKTYRSLHQLKTQLEREGKEKILSFNGEELITKRKSKKIRYGLALGEVSETVLDEDTV